MDGDNSPGLCGRGPGQPKGGNMPYANDMSHHESWTTEKEIKFIDGLGTWRPFHKQSHEVLLLKYLTSMKFRTYWGAVDEDLVRSHVRKQLGV